MSHISNQNKQCDMPDFREYLQMFRHEPIKNQKKFKELMETVV